MLRVTIMFFITTILSACGGGGGGSSAPAQQTAVTPAATPAVTYTYDRLASAYAEKLWDSVSVGRFVDPDQEFLTDYSVDLVTAITEKTNSIDVDISGSKLFDKSAKNLAWSISSDDITNLVSCDDSSKIVAARANQSFSNADVSTIGHNEEHLAGLNIQYTNIAWVNIDYKGTSKEDDFPIAYGDATVSGDLPKSGNKTYNLDEVSAVIESWSTSLSTNSFLAEGTGSIAVNFDTNKVTGSIVLSKFWDRDAWIAGGGCSGSQLLGWADLTATINGDISDGDMTASIIINQVDPSDGETTAGKGTFLASLFGPNGSEIGATFFLYEDSDIDENNILWWDGFGGAYGD